MTIVYPHFRRDWSRVIKCVTNNHCCVTVAPKYIGWPTGYEKVTRDLTVLKSRSQSRPPFIRAWRVGQCGVPKRYLIKPEPNGQIITCVGLGRGWLRLNEEKDWN